MNKFITSEQFLSQSKEVQDKIKERWYPQIGDLFINNGKYKYKERKEYCLECINQNHIDSFNADPEFKLYFKKSSTPLLTEGNLRELIESFEGVLVELEWDSEYIIDADYRYYTGEPDSPLQAYWNALLEIVKERC
jgi:hypothetical protein